MPRGEKEKRQQTILMRLLRDGRVNTHDLSTEFGITDVAIRGDFDDIGVLLKSRGLFMNRFYGGAELIQPGQHYRGFCKVWEASRRLERRGYRYKKYR